MRYGIAQAAAAIQTAELAVVVRPAQEQLGPVGGPLGRPADESRNRGRYAGDRAHAAGNFFDVNSRVSCCYWHDASFNPSKLILSSTEKILNFIDISFVEAVKGQRRAGIFLRQPAF